MSSHLTEKQLDGFRLQTLTTAELLAADEHLATCESCRHRLDVAIEGDVGFAAMQAELFANAQPEHLSFEQTADFADSRLAGEALQMANDHLAACGQCRVAVEDLQTFSREIADNLKPEVQPAPIEAESFWQRVKSFFAARSPILVYSAGLALLVVGAWLARQLDFNKDNQQVAITKPSPTVSPSPEVAPVKLLTQLNDGGGQLALDERGVLSGAEDLPAEYQQLLKQALTEPRLARPVTLNGLGSPSASLMSGGSGKTAFVVIEPVAKISLTDRPTLRWQPLAGAASYEVEVFDGDFNSVLKSEKLQATSWKAPQALARGRVFAWQVKAIKDGQEFKAPQPP
ncbi:MAG: hypothetical protein AAB401_18455, partial [Acidobacteriota bacterium]